MNPYCMSNECMFFNTVAQYFIFVSSVLWKVFTFVYVAKEYSQINCCIKKVPFFVLEKIEGFEKMKIIFLILLFQSQQVTLTALYYTEIISIFLVHKTLFQAVKA